MLGAMKRFSQILRCQGLRGIRLALLGACVGRAGLRPVGSRKAGSAPSSWCTQPQGPLRGPCQVQKLLHLRGASPCVSQLTGRWGDWEVSLPTRGSQAPTSEWGWDEGVWPVLPDSIERRAC